MRAIKYNGKLMTFAGKILRMAEWVYNEGMYYLRTIAGGGTVRNRTLTEAMYKLWEEQGRLDNIRVAWFSEAGSVQRASGIYRFFSKLFSLDSTPNDIVQATANSQPYVVNGALVNPNGGSRFMTHPTVSFGAGDAWSVGFMINHDNTKFYQRVFSNGGGSGEKSYFSVRSNSASLSFFSESGTGVQWINNHQWGGKNIYYNLVAYGNGTIELFANAVSLGVRTYTPAIETFKALNQYLPFFGTRHLHTVESGALTTTQILEEYNLLRSYIPEIATTLIGTDEIATENCQMVATPKGNVINLNNLAANTELITNAADREFSSDTGFWVKAGGATINNNGDGVATLTGSSSFILTRNLLTAGRLYRFRFTLNGNLGRLVLMYDSGINIVGGDLNPSQNKTYELFLTPAGGGNFLFYSFSFIGTIDNVSIEEVGWAGAADLYTAIYNQTSGTVAQKTLAALKAAAMWRSPDSDLDKQAVYGKLFNGYAVDLLKMDIDTYNAENPTAPWGYHIATRADLNAIATELGGEDVAGMKMKETGTDYWLSDNGDNTSGVSVLGSGLIDENGNYVAYNEATGIWTSDAFDANNTYVATIHNDLDKLITE